MTENKETNQISPLMMNETNTNLSNTTLTITDNDTDTDTNIDTIINTIHNTNDTIDESDRRKGTMTSASFNILCTMVGGGSLSLPLAFHQAGAGFFAPFLLLLIAFLVSYSIHLLIHASNLSTATSFSTMRRGNASYESMACSAFGPYAKYFTMFLISTICFFTIVGYGVLLRDMLLPLSDLIFHPTSTNDGPTLGHNITLLTVVLFITPLCTIRDLTPLQSIGAASMTSILIVSCCISYRSIECNFSSKYDEIRKMPWYDYIHYFPSSSKDEDITSWDNILNALPIFISVFMCHFNILPVYNEIQNPSKKRVDHLIRITVWGAFIFYFFTGLIGSMYGNCTESGVVQGNVLLSFREDDVLLMIGRGCLSLTITFAFPVLVVPARDTFLRGVDDFLSWWEERFGSSGDGEDGDGDAGMEYRLGDDDCNRGGLEEPLLLDSERGGEGQNDNDDNDDGDYDPNIIDFDLEDDDDHDDHNLADSEASTKNKEEEQQNQQSDDNNKKCEKKSESVIWRIVSSICILWAGAGIACCVKDIDIVWDFLGGSFSLIMGFTIPSGCFLVLTRLRNGGFSSARQSNDFKAMFENAMAWVLLVVFIPLMFMLTGNTIYNLGF